MVSPFDAAGVGRARSEAMVGSGGDGPLSRTFGATAGTTSSEYQNVWGCPAEALRAATINAARMLRRETEQGTVDAGKLADLVVLDADPLVDIRNVTRLHRVIKDGVIFDPVKLLASH